MDAGLLSGPHTDGLSVHCVADGVGLGVFQSNESHDQVPAGGFRQGLIFGNDLVQKGVIDLKVVSALLKGDAEDLLVLLLLRHIVGVDLHNVIIPVSLGFENFQGLRLVAGGDNAVGHFPLDEGGGGHIAHVGEGHPVTEGAHAVGASGSGVGAGQGGLVKALDIVHKAGPLQLFGQWQAAGRAGGADVLEGGGAGQAGGLFQLPDQLPGVEGVQEVDVSGPAGEDLDGQLTAVIHVDAGGLLVGVAAVLQFKFLHGSASVQ